MKFERPRCERKDDSLHSVRITLSSNNMKNLKKVCSELVSGANGKGLKVNGDEVRPQKVSSLATQSPYEPGYGTPGSYQRQSKKGCTNFRWSPIMTEFLLTFLIEQAKLGMKTGRTFKKNAFVAAAEAVTEKFKLPCTDANVENRLRTIRTHFQQIRGLQSMNNVTWDEKEKKIVMDEEEYVKYIVANARDEPFLNKRIEMYDEMVFIFDNDKTFDTAGDGYAKENDYGGFILHETNEDENEIAVDDVVNILLGDEDLNLEVDWEPTPTQPPMSLHASMSSGSPGRNGQSDENRNIHNLGDKINYLTYQIGELAEAIKSSRKGISEELYSEVMKCDGYDEVSLGKAFDYLLEHEKLGRGFLVKSRNLRLVWLDEFFSVGGKLSI